MIIRLNRVSMNAPKHKVWKGQDGLWHVSRSGSWVASYGSWTRAIRCATDGIVWE